MKIGVIGAGAVGSACLFSSILRGIAREIVVVNRDRKRAKAVVTDLQSIAAIRQAGSSCSSRTWASTGSRRSG
jgi:L-lactate dehydrogenase